MVSFNGHLYQFQVDGPAKKMWRCVKRSDGCTGRLHTDTDITEAFETGVHNHVADQSLCDVKEVLSNIKLAAKSTQDSPSAVISAHVANVASASLAELPSLNLIKRTVQRARAGTYKSLGNPNHRKEIELPDDLVKTSKAENFLLYDSGKINDRFMVFSTVNNLQFLEYSDNWYCDGTFKVCPSLFEQLFIIHGLRGSSYFPLVYMLLPNKTTNIYEKAFSALKSIQPGLAPVTVMTDFEKSSINAIKTVFPNVTQQGCFFHFAQCNFRHIREVPDLLQKYNTDSDFALHIRYLVALALVPAPDVISAYDQILDLPFFINNEDVLSTYINYFQSTWMFSLDRRGARKPPLYSIGLWNCHDSVLQDLPKTNNACESFHSAFARYLSVHHPSVYKLIRGLLEQQALTEAKMEQYISGSETTERKKKYVELARRLKDCVGTYSSTPRMEYIRKIANIISFH
jgi:hypothetical protein